MADHDPMAHDSLPAHEVSDVDVRSLARFTLGLVVVLAAVAVGVWWLMVAWKQAALRQDAPRQSVTRPLPMHGPRLQEIPSRDLATMRAAEQQRLNSYGWIDRQKNLVHTPVADAIERIARDGLPRWPPAPEEPSPKLEGPP